jgi:hypothetical protein
VLRPVRDATPEAPGIAAGPSATGEALSQTKGFKTCHMLVFRTLFRLFFSITSWYCGIIEGPVLFQSIRQTASDGLVVDDSQRLPLKESVFTAAEALLS